MAQCMRTRLIEIDSVVSYWQDMLYTNNYIAINCTYINFFITVHSSNLTNVGYSSLQSLEFQVSCERPVANAIWLLENK